MWHFDLSVLSPHSQEVVCGNAAERSPEEIYAPYLFVHIKRLGAIPRTLGAVV